MKLYNIKNALWYSVEHVTTIMFGLLSVVLVARLFGPESLGKLSYIQAISAMTVFITALGLDHIVVRDLSRNPGNTKYISTILITQLVAWLMQTFIILSYIYYSSGGVIENDIFVIFLFISISVYFSRATVLRLYFQSINKPNRIGLSALISKFTALGYLGIAIYDDFSYEYVIAFIPIQTAIRFFILLYYFTKEQTLKLEFDFEIMKKAVVEALPLITAGAIYPIFMHTDIVLISELMSDESVGIYSSASKLATQLAFVGTIVTMTFYLPLSRRVDSKSTDMELYISGLISVLFIFGVLASLTVSLLSEYIVRFLYGEKFIASGEILSILVWKTVFVYMAALFSRLLILMSLAKYELVKSIVAATFSLIFNVTLIPIYGLKAAAIISVLSFFIADFLMFLFIKPTRPIFNLAFISILNVFIHPLKTINNINYVLGCK